MILRGAEGTHISGLLTKVLQGISGAGDDDQLSVQSQRQLIVLGHDVSTVTCDVAKEKTRHTSYL